MNAIEKLRQARNKDELAREIEPLAQALAALADDSRAALTQTLQGVQAAMEQAQRENRDMQERINQQVRESTKEYRLAAETAQEQANRAARAAKAWTWRQWALALSLSVIVSMVAPTAYVLWQNHYSETATDAARWQAFVQKYQGLTEKERTAIGKIMGW
jgi:cell division septum initiation protein DivIVA